MAYIKQNVINAAGGGDSGKEAVLKNDDNVDDLYANLNAHDHSTGKGGTVSHTDLSDIGTTTHADLDIDHVKLGGIEATADVTDTANVTSSGALMDSELTSLSGVKSLTVPDSTTISVFGASLIDDAADSDARTTLGLVIGTDVPADGAYGGYETVTRTVTIATTDNTAAAQAKIDAVGKYIDEGVVITFQFADGTHTHTAALEFNGFYGGGEITIQGNTGSDSSAADAKTVNLDMSASSCAGISISHCTCYVKIASLRVKTNNGYDAIYSYCSKWVHCLYVSAEIAGATGYCIFYTSTNGRVDSAYVTYGEYGIICSYLKITCGSNHSGSTNPKYGLGAVKGSTIAKASSTQPSGSTANEDVATGGVIR